MTLKHLFLVVAGVVVMTLVAWLWSRLRRRSLRRAGRVPSVLVALLSAIAMAAPSMEASGMPADDGAVTKPVAGKGDKAALATMILAAIPKPTEYPADDEAVYAKAAKDIDAALAPFVASGELSEEASKVVALLYEECVKHGVRKMATCYKPIPKSSLYWTSGGQARTKIGARLQLLESLNNKQKLDPAAVAEAKAELEAQLEYLEAIDAYLAMPYGPEADAYKQGVLDALGKGPLPVDATTKEAVAFLLKVFGAE